MSYKLKPPSITGATEKEQLAQLKSYLFQLVGDMQYALNDLEKKAATSDQTATVQARSHVNGTTKQTEE